MPFRVTVFDDNVKRPDTLMAEAAFEMTGVFQSPGNTQSQVVTDNAVLTVNVEQSIRGNAKGMFTFQMRGLNIKNVESGPLGLGQSDPFYEIAKKHADLERGVVRWNTVYRSETITDNLNPMFKPKTLSLEELCYCDLDCPLRISIFDWEKNAKHKLIGEVRRLFHCYC